MRLWPAQRGTCASLTPALVLCPLHRIQASCAIRDLSCQQDYRRLALQESSASFAPVQAANSSAGSTAQQAGQQAAGAGQQALYYWPLGQPAEQLLHSAWQEVTKSQGGSAMQLQVGSTCTVHAHASVPGRAGRSACHIAV
jgi:hypothetical protein